MTKIHYAVVTGALLAAILINLAALYLRSEAQAPVNRAGLVVQYPDGQVATRCVTFTEPEITGYDLLRRANMQLLADVSSGGLICKIGSTGCNYPAQQCFCDCQDLNQTCIYWIYFLQASNTWKYSVLGPFTQKVTNGSVNGWIYGPGNASSASVMPPLISLDEICNSSSAPATQAVQAPVPSRTVAASATVVALATTITPIPTQNNTPTLSAAAATPMATTTILPTTTTAPQQSTTILPTHEPSPTPMLISPTAVSTPIITATDASSGYAVFAVIAVVLIVGLVVAQRRIGSKKS